MAKEGRSEKLGRVLAEYLRRNRPPMQGYIVRFLEEFANYSDEPRKKGDPVNSGCVHELEGLEGIAANSPEDLARAIKEIAHLMYNKQTAKRFRESFTKYFVGSPS